MTAVVVVVVVVELGSAAVTVVTVVLCLRVPQHWIKLNRGVKQDSMTPTREDGLTLEETRHATRH